MSNLKFNLKNTKEFSIAQKHSSKDIYTEMVEGTENIVVSAGFNVKDRLETKCQIVIGFTRLYDCVENGVIKDPSFINQKIFMNKEELTLRDLNLDQQGHHESVTRKVINYYLLQDQLTNKITELNSSNVFYIVCKFKIPETNEFYYSVKTLQEVINC
jgi:hypothetical protein